MNLILKTLSQVLFIPLIEKFGKWILAELQQWMKERADKKELERKAEETRRKVEEYENAHPDDAFDVHP